MKNNQNHFRSSVTFSSEYEFLSRFNPFALDNKCRSFRKTLPNGFIETITGEASMHNPIVFPDFNFDIDSFDVIKLLDSNHYDFNQILNLLKNIGSSSWNEATIHELMSIYGTETFGLYLPFHNYYACKWGIYLFPEIMNNHVDHLYEKFKNDGYELDQLRVMYFFAIYRHELFHYQTERFATKLELITHQAHYKGLANIDAQVRNSEDWLEEALAEATVLDSILVSNRSKMGIEKIRKVYKHDLKQMPAGYRDYACEKFGGHHNAHNFFASQIKEMKVNPAFILTDLFNVKGEFSINDHDVPLYIVTGFNNIQRLQ
jgi:hypothetical protein